MQETTKTGREKVAVMLGDLGRGCEKNLDSPKLVMHCSRRPPLLTQCRNCIRNAKATTVVGQIGVKGFKEPQLKVI